MSSLVELDHGGGVTPIHVGAGALDAHRDELASWLGGRTVFVVTSAPVWQLHGASWDSTLSAAARLHVLEAPDGEAAKSTAVASELWSEMLRRGGKRDSRLVAFGGGTTTDLGGFVAGCFLRGIEFVGAPTTLLGQVDAAIGGKTGINLAEGKNTVGLFCHPARVVCDTRWLSTLPRAELRAGLVEVIKMAFLLDPPLLDRVETDRDELLAGDAVASGPAVLGAVRAKVDVVARDPTERGLRRLLNFGHTLGHAIEAVLGYGQLRHGEAVGYGILFALRLSERRGLAPEAAARLRRLLAAIDLPPLPRLQPETLVGAMARDKKAREGALAWVLAAALGEGRIVTDVSWAEVETELADFLCDPWSGSGASRR